MICLIQDFEAGFLRKVSLKILNSGLIMFFFTHACMDMGQKKMKNVTFPKFRLKFKFISLLFQKIKKK